jgi:hypothetical protein
MLDLNEIFRRTEQQIGKNAVVGKILADLDRSIRKFEGQIIMLSGKMLTTYLNGRCEYNYVHN